MCQRLMGGAMLEQADIETKAETLRSQMQAKLGVKSRTLAQAMRRAGRRLPRQVRAQGALLAQAEVMAGNPKQARTVDPLEVNAAYDTVLAYLRGINVAERRKGRMLDLGAAIALNILVVFAGFVFWLWWQGYV